MASPCTDLSQGTNLHYYYYYYYYYYFKYFKYFQWPLQPSHLYFSVNFISTPRYHLNFIPGKNFLVLAAPSLQNLTYFQAGSTIKVKRPFSHFLHYSHKLITVQVGCTVKTISDTTDPLIRIISFIEVPVIDISYFYKVTIIIGIIIIVIIKIIIITTTIITSSCIYGYCYQQVLCYQLN